MFRRDKEVKEKMIQNPLFFWDLEKKLGELKWKELCVTIFTSRNKLGDSAWMNLLSKQMEGT